MLQIKIEQKRAGKGDDKYTVNILSEYENIFPKIQEKSLRNLVPVFDLLFRSTLKYVK